MHVPWNRGGFRSYLMLLGLLAGYTTPAWIACGSPFVLVGIALHLWSKGCLHQNSEVTTTGPYRFVRHPFYLANAFLDLGLAIMTGWWVLQMVLPFWWLAVYVPTIRKEETLLTALFGDGYTAYRERVPLIIPYRRPLPSRPGGFSWFNPNLAKVEVPRAFRFLSYPLMFVISYRLHSDGLSPIYAPTLVDVMTVTAFAALYTSGQALQRHFKHHRPILPSWCRATASRFAIPAGVIAVGLYVTGFEVEVDWAIWPLGLTLVGMSVLVRIATGERMAVAEALLAIGLAVLFEIPWLGFVLLPLYLAIALDSRLSEQTPARKPIELPNPLRGRLADVGFCCLLASGVILSVAVELWM